MAMLFDSPPLPLPPMRDAVDLFGCAIQLASVNYGAQQIISEQSFTQLTCIVSLLQHPHVRLRLASLPRCYPSHFQFTHFSVGTTEPLTAHVDGITAGFGTVVIVLPSPATPELIRIAADAVAALRASVHLFTSFIGVASAVEPWSEVLKLDGWLQCGLSYEVEAAEQVFAALATLMSPDTMTCVDEDTLVAALAVEDGRVARGYLPLWVASPGQLLWAQGTISPHLLTAMEAIVIPLTSTPDLRSSAAIVQSVRRLLPHAALVTLSACATLQALPLQSQGRCPVLIVAR